MANCTSCVTLSKLTFSHTFAFVSHFDRPPLFTVFSSFATRCSYYTHGYNKSIRQATFNTNFTCFRYTYIKYIHLKTHWLCCWCSISPIEIQIVVTPTQALFSMSSPPCSVWFLFCLIANRVLNIVHRCTPYYYYYIQLCPFKSYFPLFWSPWFFDERSRHPRIILHTNAKLLYTCMVLCLFDSPLLLPAIRCVLLFRVPSSISREKFISFTMCVYVCMYSFERCFIAP